MTNINDYEKLATFRDVAIIIHRENGHSVEYESVKFDEKTGNIKEYLNIYEDSTEEYVLADVMKDAMGRARFQDFGVDVYKNMEYSNQFLAALFIERPEWEYLPASTLRELYDNFLTSSATTGIIQESVIVLVSKGVDIESQLEISEPRIFIDMDGTLTQFEDVPFERLMEENYFYDLKPNKNFLNNIKNFIKNNPNTEVYILSNVLTESRYAQIEKSFWLDKYLPEIDSSHRIFPPCSSDTNKADYIPCGIKRTDLLIDDYSNNLIKWREAGGTGLKILTDINGSKGSWAELGGKSFLESCTFDELETAIHNTVFLERYQIRNRTV